MFELYLFILTLAIGYYYETSVKEYSIANKKVINNQAPKIKQFTHFNIDENNPYIVKIVTEVPIELEHLTGIPDYGKVYNHTETINYLERPFEEWPEELLDRYIKNEEEYEINSIQKIK